MQLFLRAREKLYINGAVLRVDRKTTIELLNEATFLLGNHVMQAEGASSPLRRIYFAVQVMLIDPTTTEQALKLVKDLIGDARVIYNSLEIHEALEKVNSLTERARYFESLKVLRALFPLEDAELGQTSQSTSPEPANGE